MHRTTHTHRHTRARIFPTELTYNLPRFRKNSLSSRGMQLFLQGSFFFFLQTLLFNSIPEESRDVYFMVKEYIDIHLRKFFQVLRDLYVFLVLLKTKAQLLHTITSNMKRLHARSTTLSVQTSIWAHVIYVGGPQEMFKLSIQGNWNQKNHRWELRHRNCLEDLELKRSRVEGELNIGCRNLSKDRLTLPGFSVQTKHKDYKNMNSVQQQCETPPLEITHRELPFERLAHL